MLALVLSFSFRGGVLSWSAVAFALTTFVSSLIYAHNAGSDISNPIPSTVANAVRLGGWIGFLGALLQQSKRPDVVRILLISGHALWVLLVVLAFSPNVGGLLARATVGVVSIPVVQLLSSVLMLLLVEQIYRSAREKSRKAIRFYCLGLGIPAAFDLAFNSHAVLFADPLFELEVPRGFVFALAAPLVAVGLQRTRSSTVGIFVSRQVMFHSASITASGIYLIAMALVGYSIRSLDWRWGPQLQAFFIVLALGLFVWVLYSDSVRAWIKVWLQKHFYENRYDYREEWLRLTRTLASRSESQNFHELGFRGLAQIMETSEGAIWSVVDDEPTLILRFRSENSNEPEFIERDHSIVEFLEARNWIVDLQEVRSAPENNDIIVQALNGLEFAPTAVLVPLLYENQLIGLVALERRTKTKTLNYEDHDLLKTAANQVANYFVLHDSSRMLAANRQFDAFNKLTAFVMHDLNNLIAQQRLIIQNADKHRDNPLFVDDAFKTIGNSVKRVDRLLSQLRNRTLVSESSVANVAHFVEGAIEGAADNKPIPRLAFMDPLADSVHGDADRLEAVLGHILRNAQDATEPTGAITVEVRHQGEMGCVRIDVTDDGEGMSQEFIRDHLFSPFVSTKGSKGMGIGVYQTREYLRELGGDLEVESTENRGTRMRLVIPAAETA